MGGEPFHQAWDEDPSLQHEEASLSLAESGRLRSLENFEESDAHRVANFVAINPSPYCNDDLAELFFSYQRSGVRF